MEQKIFDNLRRDRIRNRDIRGTTKLENAVSTAMDSQWNKPLLPPSNLVGNGQDGGMQEGKGNVDVTSICAIQEAIITPKMSGAFFINYPVTEATCPHRDDSNKILITWIIGEPM